MNKLGLGALGEKMASDYLAKQGYKIIDKNCIFAGSELDIVAILPKRTQKLRFLKETKTNKNVSKQTIKNEIKNLKDILVFVEVKYSSSLEYGQPSERVNEFKKHQIIRAAEGYIQHYKCDMPCRFDVISIVGDKLEHIEDAFTL